MEDGNVRFSMKRKTEVCVNITQLSLISYLIERGKCYSLSLLKTPVLYCFSSTIDENTDAVHLVECFIF